MTHAMKYGAYHVRVGIDYSHDKRGEVLLDIEGEGDQLDQWIIMPLTPMQAAELGGLLGGTALSMAEDA